MIDGVVVQEGWEVFQQLEEAKRRRHSFIIWFVKDPEAILREQREAEEKKQREEAERKAAEEARLEAERLEKEERARQKELERERKAAEREAAARAAASKPFEHEEDKQHLAMLHKEFPFQGLVEGAENRAITLPQLQHILQFTATSCFRWVDTSSRSATYRQTLSMEMLNLYHLNSWLIMPATKEKKCSMVELLSSKPQPPSWFVSHWWGEPVAAFISCVQHHATTRKLPPQAAYWVCAYANRQHALDEDLTEDPKQTSFFKAMAIAEFKVLLILDAKTDLSGPATPFTRIWCAFEETMCLDQAKAPLDVATSHTGGSQSVSMLTREPLEDEAAMDEKAPGSGSTRRVERERDFPLAVMEAGLSVELEKAQASVAIDRTRILNCIAGRELNLEPPLEKHKRYDETNQKLRGLFALAFWRRVNLTTGSAQERDLQNRLKMRIEDAMRHDVTRTSLDLSLAGGPPGDQAEQAFLDLTSCLPSNLRELTLDLSNTGIGDVGLEALAMNVPASLEAVSLDFSHCPGITDDGIAALRRHAASGANLKKLKLGLHATGVSDEMKQVASSLETFLSWEPPPQKQYKMKDDRKMKGKKMPG